MIQSTTFVHDGTVLAASLHRPDGATGDVPAVVTAQGIGNVKEVFLPDLAEHLAAQGIATLAFDYIGFGESDGELRQHVDPAAQIAQFGAALDHLEGLAGIDGERLGVCGVSLAGGHAMRLAATDGRLKAAVGLVPFVATDPDGASPELIEAIIADAGARSEGRPYGTLPLIGEPGDLAVITADAAAEMATLMVELAPTLRNEITLASLIEVSGYRPLDGIDGFLAPLRVVVAADDTVNPPEVTRAALAAFDGVDEVEIPGTHFTAFTDQFTPMVTATVEWFTHHLVVSEA